MSNTRDPYLRRLARAARVGGRNTTMTPRTHYLTPNELQGVSAGRLVRETAWAERTEASPQWRDERRGVIADEYDRRGFPDTATDVRAQWSDADYARARVQEAEAQAQQAARQAEYQREQAETARENTAGTQRDPGPSVSELGVIAASAGVLASLGQEIPDTAADSTLQTESGRLDMAWADVSSDPAIGGQPDVTSGGVEADMSDSLSMAAADITPEVTAQAGPEFEVSSPEADL